MIAAAPDRVAAAVALQPIGLDDNREEFRTGFMQWRDEIAPDHPEASDADWDAFWQNTFGGDERYWSVPDAFVDSVTTPFLVCQGNDVFHPRSVSRDLVARIPGATLVERWRDPADQPAARAAIDDFLERTLLG